MDNYVRKKSHLFRQLLERGLTVLIILLAMATWELGVHVGWLSPLFFPPPSTIFLTFIKLIHNKKLLDNTGTTLWRVFQGLLLGGIPGFLLGLIMGWSHQLYTLINPFVAAGHPIPKIAILPLIMIIFGIGESSKVVVIALTAFFPLLINTTVGVQQISPIHFDVAKNYGANLTTIFTRVTFPGSLPFIMTGLRLSLNLALLVAIAVELVSAQEGLGAMIWLAWQTFRTEELYVSLAVTAILGIVFNFLLQRISLYLVPWQTEQKI
jgi:ABC-type nitrate/sulfonate/bicarbonate transport system permease component